MPLVTGAEGDVTKVFMTDVWLVDRYVGSTLWNWGRNYQGGLGDNTTTNRSSPVQTVGAATNWRYITSGMYHTIGIKSDSSMWVWGFNNFGQLGTQNIVNYSSPVTTNPSGTVYYQPAAGYYHSAVIKTDGTLWMWGYNFDGELGTNDRTNRSSMIQTVSGGNSWKDVHCGLYHTISVKTDGSLWLWGLNTDGQLGDNSSSNKSSPVQTISAGTTWVDSGSGSFHSCAIKNDGSLWLWGNNTYGQLGDNTVTKKSSPVQTVSAGTLWKQVSCGYWHTAAVKLDGSLWLWGRNNQGQLGDNTTTNRSSPVQTISGGTNWKSVACGALHTIAIKTDGSLWCWGWNDFGQLGDNTITKKSSPVQTIAGGTVWKQAFGGYSKSHAVKNG
jgi:alpha-tubulin suppressor-like RCC1 family protein